MLHPQVFNYEGGGASTLLGVAFHPVPTLTDGTNKLEDLSNGKPPAATHTLSPRDPRRQGLLTLPAVGTLARDTHLHHLLTRMDD